MKRIFLTALAAMVMCAAGTSTVAEGYDDTLAKLKAHLAKRGYDAEALFARTEFAIYEDIDGLFKKSVENEGIRPVNKAKKEQGAKAAEQVFATELDKYKNHIGFERKKKDILVFMDENAVALESSESEYGIPKELVASVIGIESLFGKFTGRHIAFNVYVSMYVKNYRRTFALAQLEELLAFSKKRGEDVYTYNSSYAGAIGAMQFLPWSLNRWFVGSNVASLDDGIRSVANYLAHFKKQRGSLEKAVYAYNPSKLYTQTVLDLAAWAGEAYGIRNTE